MIRITDLEKSFGPKKVLRGVNLEVPTGKTTVVIGQSGSGKSVLLKLIVGLMKPERGEIFVGDLNVTALDAEERQRIARKFGMLFQGGALFDSMTVGQNVAFGLERYSDLPADEVRAQVSESLDKVGLRGIEGLMPSELSGGMKKRVGLARAIAYRPEIMLYDEPSTGIDPIRADAINELINLLKNEFGVTSIVITHDMVSAYKVADRIAMLYEGRILATGTPAEIRDSPYDVVQQFIHGRAEGPIRNW
jgi:phospholipid/cholesterol/gamma-HCH transport system ATP-binding protein